MEFEIGVRLVRIEQKIDFLIEELKKAEQKAMPKAKKPMKRQPEMEEEFDLGEDDLDV